MIQPAPIAKIELPERPKNVDVRGAVPVSSGVDFLKEGKRIFTTPKAGGSFLPKAALQSLGYQKRLWDYYADGVDETRKFYNQGIEDYNNRLLAVKAIGKEKKHSWWEFWR